ncbi:hypothetical protein DERF_003271 [Dermatophagoides farinae]|uniref:Uncharacterized protein n=1 Tax=Dermatophagoides farinae TaxID=6954 RepID=A0A922IDC6_DERFA|nr:hypothetical protein DERF_003271 [Dermatophagoides farinae]
MKFYISTHWISNIYIEATEWSLFSINNILLFLINFLYNLYEFCLSIEWMKDEEKTKSKSCFVISVPSDFGSLTFSIAISWSYRKTIVNQYLIVVLYIKNKGACHHHH